MAIPSYRVGLIGDGGAVHTFTTTQNISLNMGRQAQLSQYSASTATIEIWFPTGYATPITALHMGAICFVDVGAPSFNIVFYGTISNIEITYGIPYVGGVGNADRLVISVESQFALAGRMQGNDYAMLANPVQTQISAMETQTNINLTYLSTAISNPQMAATTVSGTWGDWLNRTLLTINGRMRDIGSFVVLSPFDLPVSTVNFSDVANNSTNQVYDSIVFHSLADNYYTQVTVDPESYAAATVTTAGATAPFRTLLSNTFNSSVSQATDFANYLLGNYSSKQAAIASVSCFSGAQTVFKLDNLGNTNFGDVIGSQVSVAFRGTSYKCVIEGVSASLTPTGSRFTYYLSGQELNDYLILNNAVFGTLNNNRLGY